MAVVEGDGDDDDDDDDHDDDDDDDDDDGTSGVRSLRVRCPPSELHVCTVCMWI